MKVKPIKLGSSSQYEHMTKGMSFQGEEKMELLTFPAQKRVERKKKKKQKTWPSLGFN